MRFGVESFQECCVGLPALMVLSCQPDTHYSCIKARPVFIIMDRKSENFIEIQLPYTSCKIVVGVQMHEAGIISAIQVG